MEGLSRRTVTAEPAIAVAVAGSVAGRLESTVAAAGAAAVERTAIAAAAVFAASRSGTIAEPDAAGRLPPDTAQSLDCRTERAPRRFAATDSFVIRFRTELLPFDLP